MEKFIKSFVFIFLITILSNAIVHAKNGRCSYEIESLVTAPPIVTTPIYLCQNSAAVPLTATRSGGGTLSWYLTNAPAEISSAVAPTPSTVAVGSKTYYVTETISGVESTPRTPIVVNVVADNGATILSFRCDPSQIAAADKASSVFFDWANNPLISNSYNYSYTIQGGSPVSGNTGLSHWQIFGMLPGQSATLTLSSATHPCVSPQTITCTVPCGASTTTPNFPPIAPFCSGTAAPVLGTTSPNNITGTWSPTIINNTTNGSYVFTPNPVSFPCATTQTLAVTIKPLITPTFIGIPTTLCQNSTPPLLPISSNNTPAISGFWSPATLNTNILGATNYTFTPNPGQCTSATPTTVSINIVPVLTPNFANIPPFCSGTTAPLLSNTSPNGIVGTWSPAIISNTVSRNYVFTPNPNQCARTQTLNVTVTAKSAPNFAAIPAFCSGTTAPILATTSPNGITGIWSPAAISNTVSKSYVFTPNTTECATNQTLAVTVNPLIEPNFTNLSICSGDVAPILRNISPNGIRGTWSPTTIDNTASATYVFTPNPGQICAPTFKAINVTVNPSDAITNLNWTVTDAFAKNQIITVTDPVGLNYLYQLDDGPIQVSTVFENVSLGTHSITVKHVNGCSEFTNDNVLVINYPKFFTPNDDGYNDTWNVFTLQDQLNSKILIFDRYGKFLKQIFPNSTGWDGTYIGQPMPANDYWFSIEYIEQDVVKNFKSHFSLKR